MLRAQGTTDRGRIRPINEDCFAIEQPLQLCVIADGMGGHSAGEVASRIAVDAIVECIGRSAIGAPWPFGFDKTMSDAGNLLRTAVHVANARVFEAACANADYVGMGTTIVATVVRDGVLSVAHAGDSRLYVIEANQIRRLTEDDSWMAAILASQPDTDPATLLQHPMRHALTNVVGARPETTVHLAEHRLKGGERLVLTTDGVHGALDDNRLVALAAKGDDVQAVAAGLVEAALEAGSRDNCTAVVADYRAD